MDEFDTTAMADFGHGAEVLGKGVIEGIPTVRIVPTVTIVTQKSLGYTHNKYSIKYEQHIYSFNYMDKLNDSSSPQLLARDCIVVVKYTVNQSYFCTLHTRVHIDSAQHRHIRVYVHIKLHTVYRG
jgi:hypothetical protein